MRRKHTKMTDADYPAECDFRDLELTSEAPKNQSYAYKSKI